MNDSHFVRHVSCPHCGSRDNGALYSNGWVKCFGCDTSWREDGTYVGSSLKKNKMDKPLITGTIQRLIKREISEDVCKRFNYQIGAVPEDYPASEGTVLWKMRGKTVQIENYYDDEGSIVGQKLRTADKEFAALGNTKNILFGRQTVKPGGKTLVITEGAIDAMSYAMVRKNWPVVSIPNGTSSAKATIRENLAFLETFEKVILCFDNDEAGRKAVEECRGLLSPGKMAIGALPAEYKDFNEALIDGDAKAILHAVMSAESTSPDGLVEVDDILSDICKPIEIGLPWFFPELTALTYGRRFGEVYGLGAPTGGGKTDFFTEQIAYDIENLSMPVCTLFLEQKPTETGKRIAGKFANRRFHVPDDGWTTEELVSSVEKLRGKITFYDSFGETEWDVVKSRIRYVAVAKGVKLFYLDHLTAMADTSDERGSLEQIMKEMAGLANELNIIIHFISHLTTPDGTPHEEGGRIMVRHFKGSRSIGFWSYYMFGLERDQQAEDEIERSTTTLRILKDRYTGQATGKCLLLGYDHHTGRIITPSMEGAERFHQAVEAKESGDDEF